MKREEIRESLQAVLADLTRLRDEARVRVNLLGKEMRDRWLELDDRVEKALTLGRQASAGALERARALREQLRQELGRNREVPPQPPAS